ncbi:hypothetical protein [Terricaulis sp.]|uniref:hypothetical protein n=1 Tax=Terricaulis sp. TaxID=2768686 RepID=UPI003782FA8C
MRWVDVKSYIGLDRRGGGSGFRIFDRRGRATGGAPPSLATALRQLRLRCLDTQDAEGLSAFCVRALGVMQLAEAYGKVDVALRLTALVEDLNQRTDYEAIVEMLEQVMPEIEAAAA